MTPPTMTLEEIGAALGRAVLVEQVRAILRYEIGRKGFVHPVDLAKALGSFSGGTMLHEAYGALMGEDAREGRPFCTAILRNKFGGPGEGFFKKAHELGILADPGNGGLREAFLKDQLRRLGYEVP